MRSYLTTLTIIAIILIAVAPSKAQDFNWSANAISITEFAGPTGLSSRCNPKRCGRPLGGWTSQSGVLPAIVAAQDMEYQFSLSTAGIVRIEQAILTPDSGKTAWPARLIEGKGYTLNLPIGPTMVRMKCRVPVVKETRNIFGGRGRKTVYEEREMDVPMPGLTPGEMSNLEWRVTSRDKRNKLVIVIIPITWDSTRLTCAGSAIMVQQAPVGFECLTDQQAFAYLRGFVPAWASPDPAVLVQQQMGSVGTSVPPAPPVANLPAQRPVMAPPPVPVQSDGTVRVAVSATTTVSRGSTANVVIVLWKGVERQTWRNQALDLSCFRVGQIIEFRCGAQIVSVAEVSVVNPGSCLLEMHIFRGGYPTTGSEMFIVEEVRS